MRLAVGSKALKLYSGLTVGALSYGEGQLATIKFAPEFYCINKVFKTSPRRSKLDYLYKSHRITIVVGSLNRLKFWDYKL